MSEPEVFSTCHQSGGVSLRIPKISHSREFPRPSRRPWSRRFSSFTALVALSVFLVISTAPLGHTQQCGDTPLGEGDTPVCLLPIAPTLACVERNIDGSFTAYWGYTNSRPGCCGPQEIPISSTHPFRRNYLSPAPEDRGQPTLFYPGIHPNAFSTTWDGTPLTWTLRDFTVPAQGDPPEFYFEFSVVASAASPRCSPNNPPLCDTGGPYQVPCQGVQTAVTLYGAVSSDPDGFPLTYQWSAQCDDTSALLTDSSSVNATLNLSSPGLGIPAHCEVTLTVSDGEAESSCETTVDVSACSVDCFGSPFGTATLDRCGVCNGNDACVDCAGVPFGGAKIDRCGTCGGDGSLCLGCTSVDISKLQGALDGAAFAQHSIVQRAASRYRLIAKSKRRARRINQAALVASQKLYSLNWVLSFSLPQINTQCTNEIFCASVDNTASISAYDSNAYALREIAQKIIARIRRAGGRTKRFEKAADLALKDALAISQEIPKTKSVCE